MKWRIPLKALAPCLPPDLTEELRSFVPDDGNAMVVRKAAADTSTPLGDKECEQYVSTRDVDRDSEILDPMGAVLSEFKRAPQVLWGHNYALPPIGSDRKIEADEYGIRAVTQYADTELANDLWSLRRDGHLNTASVGFVPLKSVDNGAEGWSKLTEKLGARWGMAPAKFEPVQRVYTKWLLLEHSDVSVPANINARTIRLGTDTPAERGAQLQELVTKGYVHSPEVKAALLKTAAVLIGKAETFNCECIDCGFKAESEKHCADIKCPECGGQMRRAERPGPGQESVAPATEPARSVPIVVPVVHVLEQPAQPIRIITGAEAKQREALRSVIAELRGEL